MTQEKIKNKLSSVYAKP